MFIEDIEIVQIAERSECPSSVWLQSSYHLDVLGADVGELFGDLAFKRRFGRTDREVSFANFCFAGAAVVDRERGGEVVQAGAKVVDYIADHAGKVFRYGLPDPKFVVFVSGVRVTHSANQIGFGDQEGSNVCFKLSEVAFGPVDLYPDGL